MDNKGSIPFSELLVSYLKKVREQADLEMRKGIESEAKSRDIDISQYQADLQKGVFVKKDES